MSGEHFYLFSYTDPPPAPRCPPGAQAPAQGAAFPETRLQGARRGGGGGLFNNGGLQNKTLSILPNYTRKVTFAPPTVLWLLRLGSF